MVRDFLIVVAQRARLLTGFGVFALDLVFYGAFYTRLRVSRGQVIFEDDFVPLVGYFLHSAGCEVAVCLAFHPSVGVTCVVGAEAVYGVTVVFGVDLVFVCVKVECYSLVVTGVFDFLFLL